MLPLSTPVRCACVTRFGADASDTVLCDTVPLGTLVGRATAEEPRERGVEGVGGRPREGPGKGEGGEGGERLLLGPEEVLIRVKACALGALDDEVRRGLWTSRALAEESGVVGIGDSTARMAAGPEMLPVLPLVGGYEFSGVVVAVGAAVRNLADAEDREEVERQRMVARKHQTRGMALAPFSPPSSATNIAASIPLISASTATSPDYGVSRRIRVAVRPGQSVVGLCPMDARLGAASEYTIQHYHTLVPKPPLLLHEDAASIVGPGLCAFTALHYQMKASRGETILVCGGATDVGRVIIQIAVALGLRVIATAGSSEQLNFLEDLSARLGKSDGAVVSGTRDTGFSGNMDDGVGEGENSTIKRGELIRVIDTRGRPGDILAAVDEETQCLGVDAIFEADSEAEAVRVGAATAEAWRATSSFSGTSSDSSRSNGDDEDVVRGNESADAWLSALHMRQQERKRTLLDCLGAHGRWITTRRSLQLDPGETRRLALKGGSLTFMFEQIWALAPVKHGRYLHIMHELMKLLENGSLTAGKADSVFPLSKAREAYRQISGAQRAKQVGRIVLKVE